MSLQLIALEHLKPNPANVRENLGDLTELAASIRARGLLQPLVVTESRNGAYTVIDGHRRLAAAKLGHVHQLPCLTSRAETRSQVLSTMLAAALHKGLEPIEQANAFRALRLQGMTIAEIARSTGYSTATVNGRLLLIDLPREAQQMVAAKQLSLGEATQLAKQVQAKGAGSANVKANGKLPRYFHANHRLSPFARETCVHHGQRYTIGGVACGQCWEATIRADERGEIEHQPDVDEMAVQRAVDGDAGRLTPTERALAVEQLAAQGLSDGQIADRLGTTARTVLRARQRRGVPAAVDAGGNRLPREVAS